MTNDMADGVTLMFAFNQALEVRKTMKKTAVAISGLMITLMFVSNMAVAHNSCAYKDSAFPLHADPTAFDIYVTEDAAVFVETNDFAGLQRLDGTCTNGEVYGHDMSILECVLDLQACQEAAEQ